MTLTAKDVAQITRLLEESNFDELTLELDDLKLTLRRSGAPPPAAPGGAGASSARAAQPGRSGTAPSGEDSADGPPAAAGAEGRAVPDGQVLAVTAPLLGTFYRAPKPGAPPFVEVGSPVEADTIIGIIEVMKLMNTVRAGARGTVVDIVAKDGELVEYGEPLLRVRRAAQE